MTEEKYEALKEDYVETGRYGLLYIELKYDLETTRTEALNVTRKLRKGEKEQGLEKLAELLENS